jgi:hypothetical protein
MKLTVLNRQTIFDIAVQRAGDASAAFALALANDISLTEDLKTGQELIPAGVIAKDITDYYTNRQLKPATGIIEIEEVTPSGEGGSSFWGIGFWEIETDFIVEKEPQSVIIWNVAF